MQTYSDRGLHGKVVQDVGLRIVRGELAPGDTINLEEMGAQFDVSRTVIRESLKVLASKGLVDARPKRGTYVRERETWHLLDPDVLQWQFDAHNDMAMMDKLAEVREIVEPASAALAAKRRTDEDLADLRVALADIESAEAEADSLVDADLRFHRALLRASHNELVEQLAMVIETGLHARDQYVHGHRVSIKDGLRAHTAVFKAVEAARPEAARKAMLVLLDEAARDVKLLAVRDGRNTPDPFTR